METERSVMGIVNQKIRGNIRWVMKWIETSPTFRGHRECDQFAAGGSSPWSPRAHESLKWKYTRNLAWWPPVEDLAQAGFNEAELYLATMISNFVIHACGLKRRFDSIIVPQQHAVPAYYDGYVETMKNHFARDVLGVDFNRGQITPNDIRRNATEYHLEMLYCVMKWGAKREKRVLPDEFLERA